MFRVSVWLAMLYINLTILKCSYQIDIIYILSHVLRFVLASFLRVTPQTVMRVEFHPASNMAEHGKWRFYGMPIDNIELV